MMRTLTKFICGFLLFFSQGLFAEAPEFYMNDRLPYPNGRWPTMKEALKLMAERNVRTIVETGTARCGDTNFDGDGGATIIFGHWAYDNNAEMVSVDISQSHIDIASKAASAYLRNLFFVLEDSVEFLKGYQGTIDFLYLDSYDYAEDNPGPPQQHCLNEIKAAYDKLTDDSVVMIDDCNIPGGGKGKLAIEYMLERGWYKHTNVHQVILLKHP